MGKRNRQHPSRHLVLHPRECGRIADPAGLEQIREVEIGDFPLHRNGENVHVRLGVDQYLDVADGVRTVGEHQRQLVVGAGLHISTQSREPAALREQIGEERGHGP